MAIVLYGGKLYRKVERPLVDFAKSAIFYLHTYQMIRFFCLRNLENAIAVFAKSTKGGLCTERLFYHLFTKPHF